MFRTAVLICLVALAIDVDLQAIDKANCDFSGCDGNVNLTWVWNVCGKDCKTGAPEFAGPSAKPPGDSGSTGQPSWWPEEPSARPPWLSEGKPTTEPPTIPPGSGEDGSSGQPSWWPEHPSTKLPFPPLSGGDKPTTTPSQPPTPPCSGGGQPSIKFPPWLSGSKPTIIPSLPHTPPCSGGDKPSSKPPTFPPGSGGDGTTGRPPWWPDSPSNKPSFPPWSDGDKPLTQPSGPPCSGGGKPSTKPPWLGGGTPSNKPDGPLQPKPNGNSVPCIPIRQAMERLIRIVKLYSGQCKVLDLLGGDGTPGSNWRLSNHVTMECPRGPVRLPKCRPGFF